MTVAVVDSGFKLDHPELVGTYTAAQEFAGTGTLEDDVFRHGTFVAQVLAGNTVGATDHATLLLAKAADSQGRIYTDKILDATTWALDNGARVVNYSLAPVYVFSANDFLGQTFARALTASGGLGAVMVMSAGNIPLTNGSYNEASGNISTQLYSASTFFGGNNNYNDVSLIVGAIDAVGNRQPYSFYPGGETEVQSRFLVAEAPVTVKNLSGTSNLNFNGTSATAPLVSAAAAEILSRWPHMTAQATSSLLLETADQSFSALYSNFTCGSGTYSCGHYYFGTGKLDLATALQPVGTTELASSGTVAEGGYALSSTRLTLPAAFGDALQGQTLNAALFDSYGRDFGFGFQNLVGSARTNLGRDWLNASGQRPQRYSDGLTTVDLSFDAQGDLAASSVGMAWGDKLHWTWQRGTGRGFDALEQDELPLLSLAGQGALAPYETLDRLVVRWTLGDQAALEARTTLASQNRETVNGAAPSAQRHEAVLSFQTASATRLRLGYAVTQENRALLGQTAQGALALDRTLAQAMSLEIDRQLSTNVRLFGAAELGSLQVQGRTGYLRMDQARTSQWRAGMVWSDPKEGTHFGLALSQPLRVEQAQAQFHLPVGRTLDGQVLRQTQSVNLTPSGRQTNLEMAYQRPWGGQGLRRGTLGLNAIYAYDAGHRAGQSDWALIGSYHLRW
ncbi:S8 family serine peptidase [Aquabacterium sp. A08]|uniref:S8 family peptidase n=1 Tax=Aquabacterium sp. A08 TaxID=2718532 RepID=UPI001FBA760E|nr:S8 family serine peptidase [Aquabacterium sp. A08]